MEFWWYILIALGVFLGIVIFLTFIYCVLGCILPKPEYDSIALTKELIPEEFEFKTYKIKTEDGYHLNLFNLRHKTKFDQNYLPLFLQHGLGDSGTGFFLCGKEKSLPFIFAERGFDIWIGNTRGCYNSQGHDTHAPNSREYWAFSWTEMRFDIAANLKKIKEVTKHPKVNMTGHSQGGT